MKVRDVMTRGVLTCTPEDRLKSAMEKMVMRRCGGLPVVDGDRLVAMLTIRDVMLPLYPNFGEYVHDAITAHDFEAMEENLPRVLQLKVREVMTPNPITADPGMPVLKAASLMGLKNLRRLPVVEDGRLVGIVSIGDISRGLFIHRSAS